MTNQEQIDEMANDIAKCFPDKDWCFDKNMNCVSCIAMELYNAGYRKVPENALVFTEEEYIDLSRNYAGEQIERVRKETAREIFQDLLNCCALYGCVTREYILEQVEKYGVEVEE